MRKKLICIMMMFVLTFSVFLQSSQGIVQAAEEKVVVDGSELLNGEEVVEAEMIPITKGEYLQTGSSSIGKIGTGKIKVSSTTIAQKKVATIKAGVMVERLVNGNWVSYTSWTATKSNAYSLVTAKEMTVPRGYYYRVCTTHIVNSDKGYSNTDGLYVN